jgi:predicted RNA-binding protein
MSAKQRNFWIYPMTENSVEICLEREVIGAKGRNASILNMWKPKDMIVFYISKKTLTSTTRVMKFCAILECTGSPYKGTEPIWSDGDSAEYPKRIKIKVLQKKSCDIKPLIHKLDFIRNKKYWGSAFFSGIRKVSSKDFELIKQSMQ